MFLDFSVHWYGSSGFGYSNSKFCLWWFVYKSDVGGQSFTNSMWFQFCVSTFSNLNDFLGTNIITSIEIHWFHFRPRNGCLQYHTGLTGRFTSFNFIPTMDNHLKLQKYDILFTNLEYFFFHLSTPIPATMFVFVQKLDSVVFNIRFVLILDLSAWN